MSVAKTFLVSLLGLLHIGAKAQSYYFRHYQVENGLSNNTVYDCLQGKRGFIWMGTKDGLVRFDGNHFKEYRHDPKDSTTIGSNLIRCLSQDSTGILYIGTNNGLYRFNDTLENFTALATGIEVRDICRDDDNNLWFIINQTLNRFDLVTGKKYIYPRGTYFDATSLCVTHQHEFWVSTANGLLEKYDALKDSFTPFNVFAHSREVTSRWIEKIYCTVDDDILIGTSGDGAKIFSIAGRTYKDIITYATSHSKNFVRDFLEIDRNFYWIGTEAGIYLYNKASDTAINLHRNYNDPFSISDNAVYALCKDNEGGIWAGTYFGGVNYYTKQYNLFKKYFPDNTQNTISGNAVREIVGDNYGNIWIGTEDGGLNKLNVGTNKISQYKPGYSPENISYYNIHGLLVDGDKLWIGTFQHGLDIMDIRTGKVIKHYNTGSHSLDNNFIYTILKSKNGEIYIGSPAGVQRYDSITDQFTTIKEFPKSFVMNLFEDSEGTIWAGTMDHGLFFYNRRTNTKGHFFNSRTEKKMTIPGNFVTALFEDSENNLWIGTEGDGICKYDLRKKNFKYYNTNTGFPSNTALRVIEDSKKELWITTTKGLVHLNPFTEKLTVYTKANGLLTDQFNYNSGYQDMDDNIYLGSVRGMVSFNPSNIKQSGYTPRVYITGIQINNKNLEVGENSPLKKSILYTKSIGLAYNQSSIIFDFAATSFISPETIRYAYKLDGYDKDWTHITTNRKVYYTQLRPGKYVFKVKTFSDVKGWNTPEARIEIIIHPSIWTNPIAYVLYTLIALSLIFLFFDNYHKRIAEKNKRLIELLNHEKEKEIYESKIEFFTNVAHEIRTPLTLIKAPLEKIMKKVHTLPDIVRNLHLMERNTNRLIELTNQLLDFRKTETDGYSLNFVKTSVSGLLEDLYTNFLPAAERKNLSYKIKLPDHPLLAYADTEALKKILSNLLDNAIKYASTKVFVELSDQEAGSEFFCVKIYNDGVFITDALKEKIFEPFYRLKATEHINGTGVGLALTRSLAELHNGNLYVDNSFGDETIFVLKLPVHQKIEFNF